MQLLILRVEAESLLSPWAKVPFGALVLRKRAEPDGGWWGLLGLCPWAPWLTGQVFRVQAATLQN